MNKLIITVLTCIMAACASTSKKREFLDSSVGGLDKPPAWVQSTKLSWEESNKVMLKTTATVRGDERVNGCDDLARLNGKEALLSEIAIDVKGRIDNASQSISENAEQILGKVRKGEFEGKVMGLKFAESYWERVKVGETERINCYLLAEMTKDDYNKTKRSVIDKVQEVDPALKAKITAKQIEFFN